jgi:hypothetical protein
MLRAWQFPVSRKRESNAPRHMQRVRSRMNACGSTLTAPREVTELLKRKPRSGANVPVLAIDEAQIWRWTQFVYRTWFEFDIV